MVNEGSCLMLAGRGGGEEGVDGGQGAASGVLQVQGAPFLLFPPLPQSGSTTLVHSIAPIQHYNHTSTTTPPQPNRHNHTTTTTPPHPHHHNYITTGLQQAAGFHSGVGQLPHWQLPPPLQSLLPPQGTLMTHALSLYHTIIIYYYYYYFIF